MRQPVLLRREKRCESGHDGRQDTHFDCQCAPTGAELEQPISRLHADMQAFVHGRGSSFVDGCEEAFRALKINIRATAPDFRPFDRPELYTKPEDPVFQRKLDEVYTE